MRVLIIGAGMQGRGCAFDLAKAAKVSRIGIADVSSAGLKSLKSWLGSNKAKTHLLDAGDERAVQKLAFEYDVIINSAPYEFILPVTRAAIKAGVHLVDLGGDTEAVLKQLKLDAAAKANKVTVIPDCGVGPGITNIMVGHAMERLDHADDVVIRDGGLPQKPKPPLYYFQLFSIDVLINEYTGKTMAVRNHKIVEVSTLTEVETLNLPAPVGKCEATFGMGMLSTLPWSYKGRIRNMDNKFIRYPGHFRFFQTLKELGFFSKTPIAAGGAKVSPRSLTKELLEKHLKQPGEKDLYVIMASVKGTKDRLKKHFTYELLDFCDEKNGLSAMTRTTGFTASIVAQMLGNGEITARGVIPPEFAVPKEPFFNELKKRGIKVSWSCA